MTLRVDYSISSEPRMKPEMCGQDLDYILRFLWVKDTQIFKTNADRNKLALYLLMLAYTAARPGALLSTDECEEQIHSLRYKVSEHICLPGTILTQS